ncbi:hypothetical protein [Mycobacterium ostraviense]|nr:hypothetical protein [Mycobacterium ostraviense]
MPAVHNPATRISPDLGGGQERLLGVFVAGGDVVHGHRRVVESWA